MEKVLQITHGYYKTSVYPSLFKEVNKRCEITVSVPTFSSAEPIGNPEEYRLIDLNCMEQRRFYALVNAKRCYQMLRSTCDLSGFDLVHAHFINDGLIAVKLKRDFGTRFIVTVRSSCYLDLIDRNRIYRRIIAINVLKNADKIIFLSRKLREKTILALPKRLREAVEKKSLVISNGIDQFWHDNEFSSDRKTSRSSYTLITAATISNLKNQMNVAMAIAELNQEGYEIEYVLAGKIEDEPIFDSLKRYSFIRYLGELDKHQLLKAYRNADIFIMTSFSETFGLVYAEALTQGLPLIYSRGQGFDGQFPEGQVGYSVNPYSIAEIKTVIEKTISQLSSLRGNRAVDSSKGFTWGIAAQKHVDLYMQMKNTNKQC